MTPQEVPTTMFHSIGDFFRFIGIIASIGAIGVFALWQLWKEIRGD